MSDTRRKVEFTVHSNVSVVGDGDNVKIQFNAHRKKKSGSAEYVEMTLDIGRYAVKRIVQQVAAMHVRDRERLASEAARIDREIAAINQPEE